MEIIRRWGMGGGEKGGRKKGSMEGKMDVFYRKQKGGYSCGLKVEGLFSIVQVQVFGLVYSIMS